jgi:hypothetical protein
MKAKYLLGMGVVTGAFSAVTLGAGCGGSTTPATGGAGGTTTATTSTHAVAVATSTGIGGAGGAGGAGAGAGGAPTTNTTKAAATTVTINGPALNGVAASATAPDYYTFMGTAGERLYIAANAVSIIDPAPATDETNILDTVVTLYDSTGTKVLAQDDDGYPRSNSDSALFVELPTTGQYYYTVESCTEAFGTACGTEAPTDFGYQTFVADVGKLNGTTEGKLKYTLTEFYAGTSQNGATASAVPITYTVTSDAVGIAAIDGDSFSATANTHVFSFTVPTTLTPTTGSRLRTEFWLQPIGTSNGDGSTANVTPWITDSTGTTILAQANQVNYKDGDNFTDGPLDLSVPVTAGSQYFLFVKDDNAAPTAGDYYFFVHTLDSGNPLQVAGGTNTSVATAQQLPVNKTQAGAYFIDGNITALAPTQYWYEVDPPSGYTGVSASCSSLRSGSGVQGFTMDLQAQVGATGTPASFVPTGTVKTETANADLALPVATATSALMVPAGTTNVFLVVSATGQSATVTDTSYQCDVVYSM